MKKNNLQNKNKKIKFNIYWIYAVLLLLFLYLQFSSSSFWEPKSYDASLYDIEQMLKKGDVDKILVVNNEFAEVYIKTPKVYEDSIYIKLRNEDGKTNDKFYVYKFLTLEAFQDKVIETQQNMLAQDTIGKTFIEKEEILNKPMVEPIPEKRKSFWDDGMGFIWPILLIVIMWIVFARMMNRGNGGGGGAGGMFSFGKSKAQLFDKDTSVNITFNEVAGLDEAKVEIMEIVDFLKNPKRYTDLGGKIPKGALLVGPPGTGKTLLAKAVAGEAKVPFFSMSGSDFVEMFVGVGASRVRDLFRLAKEKAPCIIFIDEIDAIGRARGKNAFSGSNDERENTLNQLLTEMDGFGTNSGVIILAATNRADVLDRALMRAGRFDRQIHVELPDLEERKSIFNVHLKPLKKATDVDSEFLAKQTPGFSGADIANVCNEAALIAARRNKQNVEKQDFLDAIDRIVGGLEKRSKVITSHEKKVIAYHEAGHASVSWLLEYAHPLVKVTIVPRGKSLGAAWYLPEERQITTFEQMYDEMTSALGGRAAEQLVFGKVSTGALNDLEKVTKQSFAMVAFYGMNDIIGNLSYYDSSGQQEFSFGKPYSEKTSETIDAEVRKLTQAAYDRAIKLLTENRDKLDQLAQVLIEKEVIFRDDLEAIFGPRPFEVQEAITVLTTNISETEQVLSEDGKEILEGDENKTEELEDKSVESV